jgi:SAM-dependent methyltransferase
MEDLLYQEMGALQFSHWWYRARRQILASEISRMGLPAKASILEAGCGPGGNLAMLAQFGDVAAIEPYLPAKHVAEALHIADVRSAGLPGILPFDQKFDLVVALDVIEHVEQDAAGIQSLRAALKPEAQLLITVPAYQWLWSEHDVRNHHFRRYTRSSLRALVEDAGFAVQRASYFNSHLFPIIAAVRLGQKLTGNKGTSGEALPSPVVNRCLEAIFASEKGPLKFINYPFGVSIMLQARAR